MIAAGQNIMLGIQEKQRGDCRGYRFGCRWGSISGIRYRQLARLVDAMGQDEFDKLVSLAQAANKIMEADRGEKE